MYSLPAQNIPESQKTQDWAKSCVNAIIMMAGTNLHERSRDLICLDYYNGNRNPTEFEYLRKVGDNEFPAMLRHVPRQRPKLDLLFGEYLRRPNLFRTFVVNREALLKKEDTKLKAIKGTIMDSLISKYELASQNSRILSLKQQSIEQMRAQAQGEQQNGQQQSPQLEAQFALLEIEIARRQKPLEEELRELSDQIQKLEMHYRFNFKNEMEVLSELLVHHVMQEADLDVKFFRGFKDHCLIGRERYYVELQGYGRPPIVKKCNPSHTAFSNDSEAMFVGDNKWGFWEEEMTIPQVLDEFGPFTSEELLALSNFSSIWSTNGWYYPTSYINPTADECKMIPNDQALTMLANLRMSRGNLKVRRCFWKSTRRVNILESPGKLDPKFKLTHWIDDSEAEDLYWGRKTKKEGQRLTYRYLEDAWQGVQISGLIYRKMRRMPFQYRPADNPSKTIIPFFGWNYTRYEQPYSLIWATKDIQDLYDIVNYHRELMLAVAGRKGIFADKAQIPKDMSPQEWVYQRKVEGITYYNSAQMYNGMRPNSQQWGAVYDDTLSPSIQYLDNILLNLDDQMGNAIGVNRQREGLLQPEDPVGTAKISNYQSSLVTEIKFWEHDVIRKMVLTYCLNLAAKSYREGFVGEVIVGQQGQQILNIPPNLINLADYGLYLVNNSIESQKLNDLKNAAAIGLKTGSVDFQSMVMLYRYDTLIEIERALEYYGELQFKRQQAAATEKSQIDQQIADQDARIKEMVQAHTDNIAKMNADITKRGQDLDAQLRRELMAVQERIAASQDLTKQKDIQSKTYVDLAYLKNDERVSNMELAIKRIELLLGHGDQSNTLTNPQPKSKNKVKSAA